jgi:flagellar FliL protein
MSVTTMSKNAKSSDEEKQAPNPKRKMLVMIAVLAVVAGASWTYFRPAEAGAKEEPVPGEVLKLEAVQLNLAEGRYLRLGIALQGSEEAGDYLEGSKALDAAIELFSGRKMEDLAQPVQREVLKDKLLVELKDRYDDKVIDVYFTDFVTQ